MTQVTLATAAPLNRWVGWRNQKRNGKLTKVPFAPLTGALAKADDPAGWTSRTAAEAWARANVNGTGGGIGLELGPVEGEDYSLAGIDLDTCRDPTAGAIEPWASEVITRINSYTEVSPSGTGVKVFLRYSSADTETLRRVMGTNHGKLFKRGKGEHPPAIELHIGNRYFAVTDLQLPGTPAELRLVDLRTLIWLVADAGPAFARGGVAQAQFATPLPADQVVGPGSAGRQHAPSEHSADPDGLLAKLRAAAQRKPKLAERWDGSVAGLQDTSRSAMDMSMTALLRRAGFTYADTKALLLGWQHGAGAEHADDDRYFRRMWERGVMREEGPGIHHGESRPLIRHTPGNIQQIVDRAERALIGAELDFYQRGSFLVRPGVAPLDISDGRKTTSQQLIPVGDHALREALDTAASWEKFDKRSEDWVAIDAPMAIAKTYKDRIGRWQLPVIAGIISAPTLRPDGSILQEPGYDRSTGLLLDTQGALFPELPQRPSREDAQRALAVLIGLVGSFPFVSEADRSVALSAILTAVVRRSIPAAPMHAFSAPIAGSGKSKLVDLASLVATGREAGVISQGQKDEELEKRLGALLLAGVTLISIDNCSAPLGGDVLCQALTQPALRIRILGKSEAPELPSNALITATGNNLILVGDLTRRALFCRLDPKCERPELRTFDSDPTDTVRAHRERYVTAALTILRAYHVAGRPQQGNPLGSFGAWSRTVRDTLIWLGQADPMGTMEIARQRDPKRQEKAEVLTQWWAAIGDRPVTARELIACAEEQDTPQRSAGLHRRQCSLRHPDLHEALLGVAGDRGKLDSNKLGYWLRGIKDQMVAGFQIVEADIKHKTAVWQLIRKQLETTE